MSRVLLDENIPVGLRDLLAGHDVFTVAYQGWKGLANGQLIRAAEAARFDVLITADQNMRFQQSGDGRTIAVIALSTSRWRDVKRASRAIWDAIDRAEAGGYLNLNLDG